MIEMRIMWKAMLPNFRILCVTESPAHAAMWCHYAGGYTGAVLEFRCADDLDSALLTAKPVRYPPEKPEIYTAEGWASITILNTMTGVQRMLDAATFTKSPDWSYESEWRVVTDKRPTDVGNFTDYRFQPEELAAVYLGPLISAADRATLIKATLAYPNTAIKNVEIGMGREFKFFDVKA
jgi:hypothetical protein